MKRSNDLLKLEKKLENNSYEEIVLSKFKCLKPEISNDGLAPNKSFLENIGNFVNQFKKSNDELLNDPEKLKELDIENNTIDKKKKYIELNLGLGVLEEKNTADKSNVLLNVINEKNDEFNVDIGEKELMEFILKNNKSTGKSRRRIRKIKKS
jgi:hypothetical protein